MSVKNAFAQIENKNKQKYYWNHSERKDDRSRVFDDSNIANKIEVNIPIFYGECNPNQIQKFVMNHY